MLAHLMFILNSHNAEAPTSSIAALTAANRSVDIFRHTSRATFSPSTQHAPCFCPGKENMHLEITDQLLRK